MKKSFCKGRQVEFILKWRLIWLVVSLICMKSGLAQSVIYVTQTGAGLQDGSSWMNAAPGTSLQQLIDSAAAKTQIWVMKGSYNPSKALIDGNAASKSFFLKSGIQLLGGFAGTEQTLSERDTSLIASANTTTLRGLGASHVVMAVDVDSTAVLDGFCITGGDARSSLSLMINGKSINNCSGAGIYMQNSDIRLTNLLIKDNIGTGFYNKSLDLSIASFGAGVYNNSGSPLLRRVTFSNNSCNSIAVYLNDVSTGGASAAGGGMYSVGGHPSFYQCYFTGNFVTGTNSNAFGQIGASQGGAYGGMGNCSFVDCYFTGNYCQGVSGRYRGGGAYGGAIYFRGTARLSGSVFSQNYCKGGSCSFDGLGTPANSSTGLAIADGTGGGAAYLGASSDTDVVLIENCVFNQNYVEGGNAQTCYAAVGGAIGTGGGIYSAGGTCLIRGSSFTGNYIIGGREINTSNTAIFDGSSRYGVAGDAYGGAVGIAINNVGILFDISKCDFTGNNSSGGFGYWRGGSGYGGAITGAKHLTNSRFKNNTVNGGNVPYLTDGRLRRAGGAYGGGVYSAANITGSLFWGNVTSAGFSNSSGNGPSSGGAIYQVDDLTNCTISNNTASGNVSIGGFAVGPGGAGRVKRIRNSIIWRNFPSAVYPPAPGFYNRKQVEADDVQYSIIQDGVNSSDELHHVLSIDPLFTSETDFHLQAGSPAIDAGNKQYYAADSLPDLSRVTRELDNRNRVIGGNVDMGAYESTAPFNPLLIPTASMAQSATVISSTDVIQNNFLITTIIPSGSQPVSGRIDAAVGVDNTVKTYNGQPFVQRYYQIESATDAATATATLTLYFSQSEFNAYNSYLQANNISAPSLPTGPDDEDGISHIIISQFHGAGGTPADNTGAPVKIHPEEQKVVWNSEQDWWEITFDVRGFSGFYLSAGEGTLPVVLSAFAGRLEKSEARLSWQTGVEANLSYFEIQQSIDAVAFQVLGRVAPSGSGSRYSYLVHQTAPIAYYRLKMVDQDGKVAFSKVVPLTQNGGAAVSKIYPNPAGANIFVQSSASGMLGVYDATGKRVKFIFVQKGINSMAVNDLTAGVYFAVLPDGLRLKFIKM